MLFLLSFIHCHIGEGHSKAQSGLGTFDCAHSFSGHSAGGDSAVPDLISVVRFSGCVIVLKTRALSTILSFFVQEVKVGLEWTLANFAIDFKLA